MTRVSGRTRAGHRCRVAATGIAAPVRGAFAFRASVRGAFAVTTALVGVLLAAPAAAGAQAGGLGSLDFPNSGAPEAQDDFVRGVLLLHSFEYERAAEAFRAAQATDPSFALAYWGEAMTHNHPIWGRQNRAAALAVMERYETSVSRAGAVAPTPREAMYLEALAPLYAEHGTKAERDQAYMEAMRRLHEAWPEDREARAFYALSILGLTNGVRDFGNYMRAAAIAQPVFLENPDHPGAAHYLIHAFDDPIHAPLGLPAARAYGASATDAGHAQHMTSHIFLAMGMWDDVVAANINATRVQDRLRMEAGGRPNWCGHYSSWLAYGYLMREDWAEAEEIMDGCRGSLADPDGDDYGYYLAMRARQIFDSASWDEVMRWPATPEGPPRAMPGHLFINGVAAFARGETEVGREALIQLVESTSDSDDPRTRIMVAELQALNALAQGDEGMAVELLLGAAELEDSLPFEFGPPSSLKPPHELLGEVLMELDRPAEAVEAFQGALRITPLRTPTLRGLSEAAHRAGMTQLAEETRSQIEEIVR